MIDCEKARFAKARQRQARNLTLIQARIMEQKLIIKYGLQKNGGLLFNQINSIAEKNWLRYGIK